MRFAEIYAQKIIGPVLMDMGLYSAEAVKLLLGTALHESGVLRYHHQDGGPAMGLYQMEPDTLNDLFVNYLSFHKGRFGQLERYAEAGLSTEHVWNLYNARYATAACRLQYYRDKEPLPSVDDLEGLAAYWKRVWNTEAGAGTPQQFIDVMERYG